MNGGLIVKAIFGNMILKILKASAFFFFSMLLSLQQTMAQCAMCRTTLENNVSQGEGLAMGAGLNTGILLLFFAPYVVVGIVAFLWYKKSKENAAKIKNARHINV